MWGLLALLLLLLATTGPAPAAASQTCQSHLQWKNENFFNFIAQPPADNKHPQHLVEKANWTVQCVAFTEQLVLEKLTLAKGLVFDNVIFCRGLKAEGLHARGDLHFRNVSVGHAGDEKNPDDACANVPEMAEPRSNQGLKCADGDDCYITANGLDPGIEPIPSTFHDLFKLDGFGASGEVNLIGATVDGDFSISNSRIDKLLIGYAQIGKAITLEYVHIGSVQLAGTEAKAVLSIGSRINVWDASSSRIGKSVVVNSGSVIGTLDMSQAVIGTDLHIDSGIVGLVKLPAAQIGRQVKIGGNEDRPLPVMRLMMPGLKAKALIISHIRSLCTTDARDMVIAGQAMLTDSLLWDGMNLTGSLFESGLALERLGSGISKFTIPKLKARDKYLCPILAEAWFAEDLGHGQNSLRAEKLEVRGDLRLSGSNFHDVHFRAATITRDLNLRDTRTDRGRLLDTRVGGILDNKDFWGGFESGDLRGFQVNRYSLPSDKEKEIKTPEGRNFERRGADWWAKHLKPRTSPGCGVQTGGNFAIGPYMMIADHMQAAGMEEDADGLRREGRFQAMWHAEMSLEKVLAFLSWAMVGFGYAPQLILAWFLGVFALAMAVSMSALKLRPEMAGRPLIWTTAGILMTRLSTLFEADEAFEQPKILPPRVRAAVIILRLTALAVVIALGAELSGVLTRPA
ncbi:hypothetical protein [Niveispirillum sp. KHB5.9]|uniref:hypothetical protein n=1 Tax=Niveispirillum sp. KHB5.9 TaxID=3400269 RepID=UPI003A8365D2